MNLQKKTGWKLSSQ